MDGVWMGADRSEEETLFRDTVRRFVEGAINPHEKASRKDYDAVSRKLRIEAGKAGILGVSVPAELGGQGAGAVFQGIAYEEIGRSRVIGYGLPWPLLPTYVSFATGCSKELVDEWMPRFLSGESELGIGITEPKSGSDVATIATTARAEGDEYVLDGEKGPVSSAKRSAAWMILARTGSKESGSKGLTQFFVESDTPGLEVYSLDAMEESADLGGFRLNGVRVSADHKVGEESRGFHRQISAFDLERVLIPMEYLGAAMDSIELAIAYTKQRIVWNRPIASFEGVMFPLVECITKLQAVRSFTYDVLRSYDAGKKITKEASMLRWYITRVALESLDTCMQVTGAMGYTDGPPHQRRYRWVRAGLFGHGTQEIQKLVIAREIMGKEVYNDALGRERRAPSADAASGRETRS
jgi:cyclohexanecarboxyl-CoA dehydrogenase